MIMAMKERTGRSRVSKADEVAAKINVPAEASQAVHSRVRPSSKTDEIARKIPGTSNPAPARPARVRPASKADEIGKKIPAPQPAAERPVNPVPQQPSSRQLYISFLVKLNPNTDSITYGQADYYPPVCYTRKYAGETLT